MMTLPATIRAGYVFIMRRAWRLRPATSRSREIEGIGKMTLHPWDYIDSRLYFFGFWEPQISSFIAKQIPEGSTCIDIGANIGYHTNPPKE